MVDNARSSLPTDVNGSCRDPRGGFHRHQFRDTRRTALVIASGPTAERTLADCKLPWTDWPAITVNECWRLDPDADACYAADGQFWFGRDPSTGIERGRLIREQSGSVCYTCDARAANHFGLTFIAADRRGGLGTEETAIRTGGPVGNSGAQAINLAYLFGARRLVLVGFDMQKIDGEEHWHPKHPAGLRNDSDYSSFVSGMGELARDLHIRGVEVINCSPNSKLPYWPRRTLTAALDPER